MGDDRERWGERDEKAGVGRTGYKSGATLGVSVTATERNNRKSMEKVRGSEGGE